MYMRPQVSFSTWQMFNKGNWSREKASPDCQCSTEEVRRMLPDCPQGAGGLPPPQVRDMLLKTFMLLCPVILLTFMVFHVVMLSVLGGGNALWCMFM